jgi:hypothetical protein
MKIRKKTLILAGIAAILALIILAVYFMIPRAEDNLTRAQIYKKAIYESLTCQYSCPVVDVNLSGKTEQMPDGKCINVCLNKIKETGFNKTSFSEEELLDDDFVYNTTSVIETCKQKFMAVNNESVLPDSKGFYNCGLKGLKSLKTNYPYLE